MRRTQQPKGLNVRIKLTKDDMKSMTPEDREVVRLAKARKRSKRVARAKQLSKGAIFAGAAAVIFKIGQNSQSSES